MLRAMASQQDAHDDHVRELLDRRTTRADLNTGRFSSLSDFPDTPSVYSPALFSPRNVENSEPDSKSHNYGTPVHPNSTPRMRSNRDRFNDPAASMLDLDDDTRSSIASSDAYDDEEVPHDPLDDDDDNEPDPRMSLLGPKMRFHSRAPWELDEDSLQEDDESDNSANYISQVRHGKSKETGAKRGLGFASSSPRSSSSRPSGESSRSQAKPKKSLEPPASQPTHPRGALHALAQASISSTSLISPSPPGSSLRNKFALGRSRPQTPTNSHPSSPHRSPLPHLPEQQHGKISSENNSSGGRTSYLDEEDVHPYAHPDLVVSHEHDPPPASSLRMAYTAAVVTRSDSIATVTDSINSNSLSRSITRSTLTAEHSADSVPRELSPRNRASTFQGKEISSPIAVHNPSLRINDGISPTADNRDPRLAAFSPPSGVSNLPGWNESGPSPTFALISLEEARAQRSRSATAQPAISSPSHYGTPSARAVPFPEQEQDNASVMTSFENSPSGSVNSRARARSISASARAKQALHTMVGGPSQKPERRDSEPSIAPSQQQQAFANGGVPGKALKHKKSGFMRLFNGREKESQPPPVPSLSDGYAAYNAQQQPTNKTAKITTHRIPVPPLSQSLENSPSDFLSNSSRGGLASSPKRTPPPLSINTSSQPPTSRASAAPSESAFQSRTAPTSLAVDRPWNFSETSPQSAPPNVSEFPALKLRPVSTMFSAQFGDHIVSNDSQPSLEPDLGDSTSPGSASSPITPGLFVRLEGRTSNDKVPLTAISEDQSSVIQPLQDQIVAAKQAWQRQIWELEGQVRDLKAEVEDLRAAGNGKDYCEVCGRGKQTRSAEADNGTDTQRAGVVNRPRARTGTSTRFGSAV